MSKENIILEMLEKLQNNIKILSGTNDSSLWEDFKSKIDEAHKILLKDKRIYGW